MKRKGDRRTGKRKDAKASGSSPDEGVKSEGESAREADPVAEPTKKQIKVEPTDEPVVGETVTRTPATSASFDARLPHSDGSFASLSGYVKPGALLEILLLEKQGFHVGSLLFRVVAAGVEPDTKGKGVDVEIVTATTEALLQWSRERFPPNNQDGLLVHLCRCNQRNCGFKFPGGNEGFHVDRWQVWPRHHLPAKWMQEGWKRFCAECAERNAKILGGVPARGPSSHGVGPPADHRPGPEVTMRSAAAASRPSGAPVGPVVPPTSAETSGGEIARSAASAPMDPVTAAVAACGSAGAHVVAEPEGGHTERRGERDGRATPSAEEKGAVKPLLDDEKIQKLRDKLTQARAELGARQRSSVGSNSLDEQGPVGLPEEDGAERGTASSKRGRSERRRGRSRSKSAKSDLSRGSHFRAAPHQNDAMNSFMLTAEKHPGRLMLQGLRQMDRHLTSRGGVLVGGERSDTEIMEPVVTRYLVNLVQQQSTKLSLRNERELRTIAEALDSMLTGRFAELGDLLMQRFRAIECAAVEGGWETAKHMELIPPTETTSLTQRERADAAALEVRELGARALQHKAGSVHARGTSSHGDDGQRPGRKSWGSDEPIRRNPPPATAATWVNRRGGKRGRRAKTLAAARAAERTTRGSPSRGRKGTPEQRNQRQGGADCPPRRNAASPEDRRGRSPTSERSPTPQSARGASSNARAPHACGSSLRLQSVARDEDAAGSMGDHRGPISPLPRPWKGGGSQRRPGPGKGGAKPEQRGRGGKGKSSK